MMKRLYLLRHAEALATGSEDKARVLSENGKIQAQKLQITMNDKGYNPDYILCSAAARTQETLQHVAPNHRSEIIDKLYNAPDSILLNAIQSTDDDAQSVMLIAHNPGIHQLAFALTNQGAESDIQSLAMGYPPCSVSIFDCPIESWADLSLGGNSLIDLIPPQI